MTTNQSGRIADNAEMYIGELANNPRIVLKFLDFFCKKHPEDAKRHEARISEVREFQRMILKIEEEGIEVVHLDANKLYYPCDGGYLAIDNSTGDQFTEWFAKEEQAIAYLQADWGTGDDFRDQCTVEVFDAKRGIGPNTQECLIFLKPAKGGKAE